MNLEQAIAELENIHTDPVPVIEFLISEGPEAADALIRSLVAFQADGKPPLKVELGLSHPLIHRIRFHFQRSPKTPAVKVATQRVVIALGAMRSAAAVPILLDLLAYEYSDARLSQAVGWALANIGEAALLPLFSVARRRTTPASARALAIMTFSYIADPRLPTMLDSLWREYRLEAPRLAIAALLGLVIHGLGEEARARAVEMERLWRAQRIRDGIWIGAEFLPVAEFLQRAFKNVRASESLPTWPIVLQMLGSV